MLRRSNKIRTNQRGDTLVEVLISIALVSAILAGAFVVSNRSQQGVRNSQEHSEALKLVQSQVEQLRSAANGDDVGVFSQNDFCMVAAKAVAASQAACTMDSSGKATKAEPAYHLSIARADDVGGSSRFTATAKWDQITGGQAEEQIVYRLYK